MYSITLHTWNTFSKWAASDRGDEYAQTLQQEGS